MSKGTVVIKQDAKGSMGAGLTKITATWPSGKEFSKYVDSGDVVNEERRQARFAEDRGYEVEYNEEGVVYGD